MQRFTSLIIICFLALFFCTIAYTIQQDASFLPEQNKEGSLPSEERSNHLLKERKATLNPALRNESKASEPVSYTHLAAYGGESGLPP